MKTFEITIRPKRRHRWPVATVYSHSRREPPSHSKGSFAYDPAELRGQTTPRNYGLVLGRGLFRDDVIDAFAQALAGAGHDPLHVLLNVEDSDLRTLRWERLCAPLDGYRAGRWGFLTLDEHVPFSLYLPSPITHRFPPIGRGDLQALLLVASPEGLEDEGLLPFDVETTVTGLWPALGRFTPGLLAEVQEGAIDLPEPKDPPTLDALCSTISEGSYTLLHIVAHGVVGGAQGETFLLLADPDGQVHRVSTTDLIERLAGLRGARGLPHLAFLATCHSASAEAEGALGGLAQRLVRELGMPAVVAMTELVTLDTAQDLATEFYKRLQEHGEVDRALTEATAGLKGRGDVTVPALFSRLGGRPLFSDALDRPLSHTEIANGLSRAGELLDEQAPGLKIDFRDLKRTLVSEPDRLNGSERQKREAALAALNSLCDKALELSFNALAQGEQPPEYDSRCPFRGLDPFRAENQEFFFGRDEQIREMETRLAGHNFLAVLGPSSSGKSSLVLAGLIPALQEREPSLVVDYIIPDRDPPAELADALSEAGEAPVLLVVDQFERLFTRCFDEAKRQGFVKRLLGLVDERRVVVTMRTGSWGECSPFPDLARCMAAQQVRVAPMTEPELRETIMRQASEVHLRFEADLENTIIEDVEGEPGAMPLLQRALLQLWEGRHGRWLPAAEYRRLGGVRQAIAAMADDLYLGLSVHQRKGMLDILVRLTRLGEAAEKGEQPRDTRRRVRQADLVPAGSDPTTTQYLVDRLAGARLVVTRWIGNGRLEGEDGHEEAEVAHEELVRWWPRLRTLLDMHRDKYRLRDEIGSAARKWQEQPMDESCLVHRGQRLADIEELASQPEFPLTALEQAYIDACVTRNVLRQLLTTLERHEPPGPQLDRLRDRGRERIRQLEELDPETILRGQYAAPGQEDGPLGLADAAPRNWSRKEEPGFGNVAWSAVSHQKPMTRQTAGLALTVPYDAKAVDRLAKALEAWEGQIHPHRWQRLWRKAEVWGNLVSVYPDYEQPIKKTANLAPWDRASIWLWRRFSRHREQILTLTLRGAVGAGLGLALLRLATALATELTPSLQFATNLGWGMLLGAGLTLGLLLPRFQRQERGPGRQGAASHRFLSSPEWQAVMLGTLGFGLAHFLIGGATGYPDLTAMVIVNLGALVMGLGISLGFYGWSWEEAETRPWHWLLRPLPVVAGALLGQLVIDLPGKEWSTAIGLSGALYRHGLAGTSGAGWQGFVVENHRALGLLDAVLVAVVLFAGIAIVGRLAHWQTRRLQ